MVRDDPDSLDTDRSERIKSGIERAKAARGKWGRPTLVELKGDPHIASRASELRNQGLSWSQIASRLDISRSSARRLVSLYQKHREGQKDNDVLSFVPNRDVSDTCKRDRPNEEISLRDSQMSATASGSERSEIVRAMTSEQGEFIKAALQLILENEKLTKQVLERIEAPRNVQKHT